MTGVSLRARGRTRWVGRSAILAQFPLAPAWLRYLSLTISFVGIQLLWSCEMAQGIPILQYAMRGPTEQYR